VNESERRTALTNRSPENQKRLLAKLREYETLKPDERELGSACARGPTARAVGYSLTPLCG